MKNSSLELGKWTIAALFAISSLLLALPALAGEGVEKGEIRVGAKPAVVDSAVITFSQPMTAIPVVIAGGQWQSDAWVAAVKSATANSFTLAFANPHADMVGSGGNAVKVGNGTYLEYIAVVPDPKSTVLAASKVTANDGDTISFGKKMNGIPAVICCAVDAEGRPLFANPSDIGTNSFVIHLADIKGASSGGTLSYIAMVPTKSPLVIEKKTLYAGTATSGPGESGIVFGLTMKDTPSVVLASPYIPGSSSSATTHTLNSTNCGGGTGQLKDGKYAATLETTILHWIGVVE
jgi:hypothetical protein